MGFTETLNGIPRPVWIMAIVLGFFWWWPMGLAALAGMVSTHHRRWHEHWQRHCGPGRWHQTQAEEGRGWSPWRGCGGWRREPPPSGNAAFDDYRAETLRRLEDEQKEFQAYLERLRRARDKTEFDRFMGERGAGSTEVAPQD